MHQLHIGIERYRAPELLFKPYMIGSSEAGLTEVIGYVLSRFDNESQKKLAANVVITGSLANLPGLKERVLSDLISIRPFQSIVNVRILSNPSLSAWQGIKNWTSTNTYKKYLITKSHYEEYGPEYLNRHLASNLFYPSPKEHVLEVDM